MKSCKDRFEISLDHDVNRFIWGRNVELACLGKGGMLWDGMTVLIGFIDGDDVILTADGYAGNDIGEAHTDEWKIAKLNSRCCVGYSGHTCWGNQVLEELFGVHKQARKEKWSRLVRELESRKITRDDLDFHDATQLLERICQEVNRQIEQAIKETQETDPKKIIPPFSEAFLMGTYFDATPRLVGYRKKDNWRMQEITLTQPVIISPRDAKLRKTAKKMLQRSNKSVEKRVLKAIGPFADTYPKQVNKNITIRRASKLFVNEPQY